ncbi:MAG: AAA+-type ATPase [Trizodia sp. TS-e1964]|nr:MAG: AAA+-type ATPase [Trizodia sp. TS-e1964]
MADSPIQQKYTVRPLSKPPRNDLKDSFKVFVSSNALYAHLKMKPGDVCTVRISSAVGTKPRRHSAIIWNAIERIQDSIIQTSIVLQELYGLKLGDKVIIEPKDSPLLDAQQIKLRDVSEAIDLGIADSALESENNHWAWFMRGVLERAEILCTGMALGPVEINGRSRSFRVDGLRSIGAGPSQLSEDLCRYSGKSSVDIASSAHGSDTRLPVPKLQISAMGIGGLSVQITRLNSFLSALCDEYEDLQIPSFKRRRFGLLIYGASGTGKSLLLEKITSAGWGKVFHLGLSVLGISGVEDEAAAIRKVFSNAKLEDRSIIVIDNIDYIASKVEAGSSGAVRALISELDQLRKAPAQSGYRSYARVLVVGSTNRLAIIDPELRKPGRLGTELEIPIPDAKSRIEILKVIQGISPNDEDEMSEYIGSRAHGYVGADLEELLQVTAEIALSRHRNMNHTHVQRTGTFGEKLAIKAEPQLLSKQALTLTLEDASQAFLEVPPTAMKEVVLEPPKIKWADIGGQENVKKKLQQAVEWPLKVFGLPLVTFGIITKYCFSIPPS